jgi:hypothetical protein
MEEGAEDRHVAENAAQRAVAVVMAMVVAVVRPRCVRAGMIRWRSVVVVLPRRVRMAITL